MVAREVGRWLVSSLLVDQLRWLEIAPPSSPPPSRLLFRPSMSPTRSLLRSIYSSTRGGELSSRLPALRGPGPRVRSFCGTLFATRALLLRAASAVFDDPSRLAVRKQGRIGTGFLSSKMQRIRGISFDSFKEIDSRSTDRPQSSPFSSYCIYPLTLESTNSIPSSTPSSSDSSTHDFFPPLPPSRRGRPDGRAGPRLDSWP